MLQRDADHAADELGREEAEERQAEIDKINLQQQRRIAHQLDVALHGHGEQAALGHAQRQQQQA